MSESTEEEKKDGLARRLFRAVGQASSAAGRAVGGAAGGLLRSAGQTAMSASGRARLTFSGEVAETPERSLRELAEALTGWLVEEHAGRADLQHEKPSTIELTERERTGSVYQIVLEEPGFLGRRFRFVLRERPLADYEENFPASESRFHSECAIVMEWPKELLKEPQQHAFLVWDQGVAVGPGCDALNLCQHWLKSELDGTFPRLSLTSRSISGKKGRAIEIFGREEQLREALDSLLLPLHRSQKRVGILALVAPGGTGKSYFLKALRARLGERVTWAGVDHQGLEEGAESIDVLARILSKLALDFEEQGVAMGRFSREYRAFKKRREASQEGEPSGFLAHLRKAAEAAAGINPVVGAASAGVTFLTSWGQEVKEESEALAKDGEVRTLTRAFSEDLGEWARAQKEAALLWSRPVLVLDTYEWLAPLVDIWVRTELLSEDFFEATGCVVVLAGRDHLLRTDTRWAEWQQWTRSITLEPFDLETSKRYLESLSADPSRAEELHALTEGSPLFLSLVAQIPEQDEAIAILSERILEEAPQDLRVDFRKAALLDNIDAGRVQVLFPEKGKEERERLLRFLTRATFTVAGGGGRAFLPSVRRILTRNLEFELGRSEFEKLRARLEESS